ncbi:dihydrofolate reductase family protein [Methylopila sp. 73B]|uniref:dihydrofolate reductase family protein n=1 Tax=Methylopila sp. 73B TaxID=1120792 RepID=UPI00036DD5B5|nr:dihydrofolate reductase family protein [Methylopila sp. 73B]
MPHIIYYAAASLDGRLAGPGDALAFLEALAEPESYGADAFEPFFDTVDAIVMGAKTFAVLQAAILAGDADGWPYGDRRTIVMTRKDRIAPMNGAEVEAFAGSPRELAEALDAAGSGRVWLAGGGRLAGAFFDDDLVDEIVLTLVPTILGEGPALAEGSGIPLRDFGLKGATQGANSVALRYVRLR